MQQGYVRVKFKVKGQKTSLAQRKKLMESHTTIEKTNTLQFVNIS